jgi:AcrR family transcriptional regulator
MMPRTPEQNDEIRQQRKKQIMTAAFDVYVEKGLHPMEMGDVAEKADVGRGTVYHYYKNKHMLLRDVFDLVLEETKHTAVETLSNNQEPIIRLELFFRQELEAHFRQPLRQRFFKYFFEDVSEVYGSDAQSVLLSFEKNNYQPLMNTFQQAINEGTIKPMNLTRLTQLFWGAFIGMPAFIQADQVLENRQEWIDDAITILFEGIKNHSLNNDNGGK